ncbi:UNVERIFIED_CONTAM: hypothetical protein Sangu_0577300 [Sesamum angustifolium]|uniref:DUF1995 domain-containing protein n=1 Tax=Sesamum angustifolium TaxID=2727405 RepID=A0AAW2QAH5_9LAMI
MASARYSSLAGSIASIRRRPATSQSLYVPPCRPMEFHALDSFQLRTQAKFENSKARKIRKTSTRKPPVEQVEEAEEDDSCLPSDLEGAVRQSGQSSAEFVSTGGMRAIVELLIPQLQFLDDEGAQVELWELSKIFLDTLIEETGCQRVRAIFPDAGAAALLKYQWKDAAFGFSSLGDRKPVNSEDEIVVMVVPDYQMLEYVQKIASDLSDDPPRPLIMWNPRLVSEDVGVGINVRRFATLFSEVLLWKVFYDDKERPNRYLLAKELISRPDIEELEIIFGGQDKSEKGTSLFDQAAGIFSSINRFMKMIVLLFSVIHQSLQVAHSPSSTDILQPQFSAVFKHSIL